MNISALTSAITDIIIEVTNSDLERFGLKKGFLNNHCKDEQQIIQEILQRPKNTISAGSSANVIFNTSTFNLQTTLIGTVGNDSIGESYIQSVKDAGIRSIINTSPGPSAICYVLITPDKKRTLFTKIGVGYKYDFDLTIIPKSQIFHTSGYELLTNPKKTKKTIEYAKRKGAIISFDLSDPIVVIKHRPDLEKILAQTDILFATLEEAKELTGIYGEKSIKELKNICQKVALKMGSKGSIVSDNKTTHQIKSKRIKVINTCGAGDAYTAGFLYGQILQFPIEQCGFLANYYAVKICKRNESNLIKTRYNP